MRCSANSLLFCRLDLKNSFSGLHERSRGCCATAGIAIKHIPKRAVRVFVLFISLSVQIGPLKVVASIQVNKQLAIHILKICANIGKKGRIHSPAALNSKPHGYHLFPLPPKAKGATHCAPLLLAKEGPPMAIPIPPGRGQGNACNKMYLCAKVAPLNYGRGLLLTKYWYTTTIYIKV